MLITGLYSFSLWAPAILKATAPTLSASRVTLLLAIPYGAAAVSMVLIGHHSDRTGERRWHIFYPCLIAFVGLLLTAAAPQLPRHATPAAIVTLSIAAVGIWGTLGTFWTLPTAFLRGTAAAGGIAIVNSLGCLSGFVAPYAIGLLRDATHGFAAGLIYVALSMLAGGILVVTTPIGSGKPGR